MLMLADNWITIGLQHDDPDSYWNKRPCLKAINWRNELLVAAMTEVNRLIDIVTAILGLFHVTVDLPKIPNSVIEYLPKILNLLEYTLG